MPKPETVGAIIALITEDRDDFDAETIKAVIESTYELTSETRRVAVDLSAIKSILEDFISQGYVQKTGDKYLVTTQGRQAFKDMWKSLDPSQRHTSPAHTHITRQRKKRQKTNSTTPAPATEKSDNANITQAKKHTLHQSNRPASQTRKTLAKW